MKILTLSLYELLPVMTLTLSESTHLLGLGALTAFGMAQPLFGPSREKLKCAEVLNYF